MARESREFRTLDKDLRRVTNAERAALQSARGVLRLGIALAFVIAAALTATGIEVIPSVANFYLIRFPQADRDPEGAARHLEKNGIIPRPVNAGGPDKVLRISVGRPHQNDRVIAALTDYMQA